MTNQDTNPQGDPFALQLGDTDIQFADALIAQAVRSPSMLVWDAGGGGFFIETTDEETAPSLESQPGSSGCRHTSANQGRSPRRLHVI